MKEVLKAGREWKCGEEKYKEHVVKSLKHRAGAPQGELWWVTP